MDFEEKKKLLSIAQIFFLAVFLLTFDNLTLGFIPYTMWQAQDQHNRCFDPSKLKTL